MDIIERFLKKVTVGGCWEWTAAKDKDGYGWFGYKGRLLGAHRIAYILFIEEIPEGKCVLHKCDNPSCVNPEHLYVGTHKQNSRDRDVKNRTARGLKNGFGKYPFSLVTKIRKEYSEGLTYNEIHTRHNVSMGWISQVVRRKLRISA